MSTAIHRRIEALNRGDDRLAIVKLASGWVCLGDVQPLKGYCVLFADPVVADFNSLDERGRASVD